MKQPIQLHPDNPHYFLWRDRPTVLITSGEHYGAVLNLDFDQLTYLDTLASYQFNLTRTFSGIYCEPPGAFNIRDNTLAPAPGQLICPWARSDEPGYAGGGNKFDLDRWDVGYIERLRGFLAAASERGIVVELVLFCPFYREEMWALSPMNGANNVNGVGAVRRNQVYTLEDEALTAVQEAMTRKLVEVVQEFDNLYFEDLQRALHAQGDGRVAGAHRRGHRPGRSGPAPSSPDRAKHCQRTTGRRAARPTGVDPEFPLCPAARGSGPQL